MERKKWLFSSLILFFLTSHIIAKDDEITSITDKKTNALFRNDTLVCNITEALFRLELQTDIYPTETSWKLFDIYINKAIHQVLRGNYYRSNALYEKIVCIPRSSCYQFTVFDQYNDGICCSHGDGYYKVVYENVFVIEGGEFGSYEKSIFFGDACPTLAPSVSSGPTLSLSPSNKPSISSIPSQLPSSVPTNKPSFSVLPSSPPSIHPSLSPTSAPSAKRSYSPIPSVSNISSSPSSSLVPSYEPSLSTIPSHQPTWSPTISNAPTASQREIDLIAVDPYGRRYFPYITLSSDGKSSSQLISKCTTGSYFAGCINKSKFAMVTPHWAGKISATYCYQRMKKKYCTQGVPMSKKSKSLPAPLVSINPLAIDSMVNLYGGDLRTVSIVAADVNADGMLDILVANYENKNQLLLNFGGGSYSQVIGLSGGNFQTSSLAAADVNGDGMVDIIIGNENQYNQLLINQGGGSFSEPIFLVEGNALWTSSIVVADINGDDMVDIIIGNIYTKYGYYGAENQVMINIGDGKFSAASNLPGGGKYTTSIMTGDVNGDDMLDIVIGNIAQSNQLLINQGGGKYLDAIDLPGGDKYTKSIVVADVNGDGMVDILVGNSANHKNQLLLNDGNGAYSKAVDLPGGEMDTQSIAAADMNGDGMVDILIANYNQNNQLLMNEGDGNYSEVIELPGGTMQTRSITAADMSGDGMVDILIGNDGQNNQLLMNKHKASYSDVILLSSDTSTSPRKTNSVTCIDINGDRIPDIIFGNDEQPNQLLMSENDGYSKAVDLPGGNMWTKSIRIADINNDGMVDMVIGNYNQYNQLLLNKGNGTFSEAINLPGGVLRTQCVEIADINGDGNVDIILGNLWQSNQLLVNKGDGTYSYIIDLPGGTLQTYSIIAADVNGDGKVDILIGNRNQNNQLLTNNGDYTFSDALNLPGGSFATKSINVADVNGDAMLDIIIGNQNQANQLLLNNGDGSYSYAIDLPGGDTDTVSIAVADVDGDGMEDIIIGNDNQNNHLLINQGGGDYSEAIDLPGGTLDTTSIAVADMNGDSMVDILIGNREQSNQLLFYNSCLSGGARLHSKSWCFQCPSFMGREKLGIGQKNVFCRECIPDHVQEFGLAEQCEQKMERCYLQQRGFGENFCSGCPSGTFFNNEISRHINDTSTWNLERCVHCPSGTYSPDDLIAIDECFQCRPGTYQPESGQNSCLECKPGSFQPDFGKDKCIPCSKGGYCDAVKKIDGGFTACPPGTYNEKSGQMHLSACIECPPGTFSTTYGAESSDTCLPCLSGTYNNITGQIVCKACKEGTFQQKIGQTSCNKCPSGTYADKGGFEECINCPYRLFSSIGSSTCPFCAHDFYLNDVTPNLDYSSIFKNPFTFCLDCPPSGVSCEFNSSLNNLDVQSGYWRHSNRTSTIYVCNNSSNICIGSNQDNNQRSNKGSSKDDNFGDIYCAKNHKGPLCEVCANQGYYFSVEDGRCTKCPTSVMMFLHFAIVGLVAVFANAISKYICVILGIEWENITSNLDVEAKLKILVSFGQVLSSFEDVYGVKLDSRLTDWANVLFNLLSLDFLQIIGFNISCISSTIQQLIIGALWPYLLVGFGVFVEAIYRLSQIIRRGGYIQVTDDDNPYRGNFMDGVKLWAIKLTVVVFYLALPTVSNSIFTSMKCRSFDDDDQGNTVSYLLVDMGIQCEESDRIYSIILVMFWIFFVVWIILTPLGFFSLLKHIHEVVSTGRITSFADACSFLWEDYKPSMIYWDVVDTLRKIFLTGCIMFIDRNEGSNKMLRLLIANVVCALHHTILLAFNPYKKKDNYYLAFISNFLLICCFSLGTILKLCSREDIGTEENDVTSASCSSFIGRALDSFKASVLVMALTITMLVTTISLVTALAVNKIRVPTLHMVSTALPPNLELREPYTYHLFMSYVLETGTKTHEIVDKIRVLLPGLKIWLDTEQLVDTYQVNEAIEKSTIFVVHYSRNYFRSEKCRAELFKAILELEKEHIILIYEGDRSASLKEMCKECRSNCNDASTSDVIIQKLLGQNHQQNTSIHHVPAIQWLYEPKFSLVSMKRLCQSVLNYLPYYEDHFDELSKGIMIPGEHGPVLLQSPINILVCESNCGCLEIANELKDVALEHEQSCDNSIYIYDAGALFGTNENEEQLAKDEENLLSFPADRPTFLLLYLNEHTFAAINDEDENKDERIRMISIIKSCKENPKIDVVLLHEQDILRGGCKYDLFYEEWPQELINPPCNLLRQSSIKLYSAPEYRIVSLRLLLCEMGGIS